MADLLGGSLSQMRAPTATRVLNLCKTLTSLESALDWLEIPETTSSEVRSELPRLQTAIDDAYARASLSCPAEWAVESGTSALVYCYIRAKRPSTVVETGIANGHSSLVILEALRRNGSGRLVSVDVREDVGGLVPDVLSPYWTKIILDARPSRGDLLNRLELFRPFELFFHDGDHRYLGQMIDYRVASEGLLPGGLLVSDDIDSSGAFIDACEYQLLPENRAVFVDRRKVTGLAR